MRKSFAYETMKAKDTDALFAMHEYLRECDKLLHEGEKPPLPALMDMAKTFGDLKRGMALDVESLSAVMDLLKASKTIRTMLEERRDCERLFEESYLLDISSGGGEKLIPFNDLAKLIGHYIDVRTKDGRKTTMKLEGVQDGKAQFVYFIKGRRKKEVLGPEDIDSMKMGYKA